MYAVPGRQDGAVVGGVDDSARADGSWRHPLVKKTLPVVRATRLLPVQFDPATAVPPDGLDGFA